MILCLVATYMVELHVTWFIVDWGTSEMSNGISPKAVCALLHTLPSEKWIQIIIWAGRGNYSVGVVCLICTKAPDCYLVGLLLSWNEWAHTHTPSSPAPPFTVFWLQFIWPLVKASSLCCLDSLAPSTLYPSKYTVHTVWVLGTVAALFIWEQLYNRLSVVKTLCFRVTLNKIHVWNQLKWAFLAGTYVLTAANKCLSTRKWLFVQLAPGYTYCASVSLQIHSSQGYPCGSLEFVSSCSLHY